MKQRSQTYYNILDLLHKLEKQKINGESYATTFENGVFTRAKTNNTSHKIPQEIVIADMDFARSCSPHERYFLIMVIGLDLKLYNALWYCDPKLKKSSSNLSSIKSLVDKGALSKTETTNIYFINPFIIRRGELFAVLTTTANILEDEAKVDIEHIKDKRSIKGFDANKNRQIGYGYTSDEIHDN